MKTVQIAAIFAAGYIVSIIEKYIFDDWHFLGFIFVAMLLDTITGVYHHWSRSTLDWKLFGNKVIVKTIRYTVMLIGAHLLDNLALISGIELSGPDGHPVGVAHGAMYGIIIVTEVVSSLKNAGIFDKLPEAFRKRFKDYTLKEDSKNEPTE